MLRCPGLPLLPGTGFRDLTKTRYHLSHHLETRNGVPMLADANRPGIGGTKIKHSDDPSHQLASLYPPYEGPRIPPWVAYDKKVLCFHAYFKESLHEVYKAPYQVRKVKILLYLEDGTMQVSEPRVDNCGLSQGCIVSRQRIPRSAPNQYEFLSILDLNVNQTVRIFDRIYHITDCDRFTRNYLNDAGIAVSDPVDMPTDPGMELRQRASASNYPKKPSIHVDTLGKFLANDRKVLRFYAYWDDRQSMFGDVRDLILYYFLADDTIQIKEVYPKNSGRDGPGTFLTRQKLPKKWDGMPILGQRTSFTVLNVLGGGFMDGRFVPDSLGVGTQNIEYYQDNDLTIGGILSVFGREIVLTDCDSFTKQYYSKKYGIEDFPIHPKPFTPNTQVGLPLNQRTLPVFNGWGSHEDSEGNCKTVEPKPPHMDFMKFIHLDGYTLRFGAKMISNIKENGERVFIITYYLSDDTMSIYEIGMRNSGFKTGEFYKRTKFILPNQEWYSSQRPKIYTPQHLYLGATIILKDFTFHLVTADEFCLKYMESKPFEFPKAHIESIMNRVREKMRPQYKDFVAKYLPQVYNTTANDVNVATVCFDTIRTALIDLFGDDGITEHEIITVARYFSAEHKSETHCNRELIRSVVHLELNRGLWDNLDRLREHIYHIDPLNQGYMSEDKLRSVIAACRIPLKPVLIGFMFSVLNKNDAGHIEICDFITFIDRYKCKSAPIQPLNLDRDVCADVPFTHAGRLVNWNAFLDKINLEEELNRETD